MNEHMQVILEKRINRTIGNLQNNKMDAYYVKTAAEVVPLVETLCAEGETVTVGGSETLKECGVIEHLKSGRYRYLDRYAPKADLYKVFREAFFCDTYLTGTNAVTEEGELYNVDGNGNRVSAMIFGPKSVIVVVGYNKIVPDLEAARKRVREVSAPANAVRLDTKTPCKIIGTCRDCHSDERMCCSYVTLGQQRIKGRIKVIIVGESLGF